MKLIVNERDGCCVSIHIEYTPTEALIINQAMKRYVNDEEVNEKDKTIMNHMLEVKPIYVDIAESEDKEEPCEDAISRQASIEAVMDLCKYYTPTKSVNHPHMDFVIETLRDLPPVTPQQKTGHWIIGKYKDTCSHCRCTYPKNIGFKNYCPNCGTKMVESEG